MVSRCVLTFCGCVLAFLIGGRLDRLTWHGLHLSRSRIARLGFLLPYASTGGVYHVVWVVYDALRPFFVSGIDRELILSLPLERYADRLG
ncbi:hypothetical protein EV363DRAFT_1349845 [Boletus edulis]|nr:hypothetical protein EV363DRAFT_1349845 [Boletus edulis]